MMTMQAQQAALITSRDKKGIAIINLLEVALNNARLDEHSAQRVFERGGELQDKVREILAELAHVETYRDEEVTSNYGYLSGYRVPSSIADQLAILRHYFPQLGDANEG